MPTPVSVTVITAMSSRMDAAIPIRPPRSVYFTALISRFENACDKRVKSASSHTAFGGTCTVSQWPAASTCGRAASTAL
jgi:hypothetical protein